MSRPCAAHAPHGHTFPGIMKRALMCASTDATKQGHCLLDAGALSGMLSPRASVHMLSPTSSALLSPQASSQVPSELRLPHTPPAHTVFSTGIEFEPCREPDAATPPPLRSAFEGAALVPDQLRQFFSMLRLVQYFQALSTSAVRGSRKRRVAGAPAAVTPAATAAPVTALAAAH